MTTSSNLLEANFDAAQTEPVVIYYERAMTSDTSLEIIPHAGERPPDGIATSGRRTEAASIITVIDKYATESSEFATPVQENDQVGDGIPDKNLERIHEDLSGSPSADEAGRYLSSDYRKTAIYYEVEGDATQGEVATAGEEVANRLRGDASATGSTVLFNSISELIYKSAILRLAIALGAFAISLTLV